MRAMKDSGVEWIGEVPENWKTTKIKHVASLNGRIGWQGLSSEEYSDEGAYLITGVNFINGKIDWDNCVHVPMSRWKEAPEIQISDGDLLVTKDGTIGKVAIVSEMPAATSLNSGVLLIRSKPEIESKLLFWILQSEVFWKWFRLINSGNSTIIHLYQYSFCDFSFSVPSLSHQKRIATFLDSKCAHIDAIIEKQQQVIEKLKAYKQSVITEAVTKGLDPTVPMKDSGVEWIGMVPEHWEVVKLRTHASMLTPMRDRPENLDGSIPWIRIEDFSGKYIESSVEGLGVSLKTVKEMNLKVYPIGTVLCTSSCELGKCAIVSTELVSNQRFIGIIPNSETSSDFLYYLMLTNAVRLNHLSTGTIQANLSRVAFEQLMLQFPSLKEQQTISLYLDEQCGIIDRIINAKGSAVEKLTAYKKSLIYEAVTGKMEITQKQECKILQFPAKRNYTDSRFAQAILLCKIIEANNHQYTGRVKLEKTLYLIETHIGFDFETHYTRQVAGPLDQSIYKCEDMVKHKYRWVEIKDSKREKEPVQYSATGEMAQYRAYYEEYFNEYDAQICRLIKMVSSWTPDRAEIIATLYAAWNDAIILQKIFCDTDIIDDVMNNWHESKKKRPHEVWLEALRYMRKIGLVPQGHGLLTCKLSSQ